MQVIKLAYGKKVILSKNRMYYQSPRGEFVLRQNLAEMFEPRSVPTGTFNGMTTTRTFIAPKGSFRFGCCNFGPKQAKIVRQWALGRR